MVGLGLIGFILGVRALSWGLRRLAGAALIRAFAYLNRHPIGAFWGAVVITAAWHSSSATTIMVVGLAESGMMGTATAIAAILGANLGTTATSQLFSLSLEGFSPFAIVLGLFCIVFSKLPLLNDVCGQRRLGGIGVALAGFGLLFTGLDLVARTAEALATKDWFVEILKVKAGKPVAGIAYGALGTMMIQSSTLLVGLVMSLASQGAVTLAGAIHLVLGSNIGTAIPTLVAGLALSRTGRQMAYVNLCFNVLGVALFLPWLAPFTELVRGTAPEAARQVANAHGLFNLITALLGLPFVSLWARLLDDAGGVGRKAAVPGRTIPKGRKCG